MRRGTTPTHIFSTGVDLTQASVLWLTYQQGTLKLTKQLSDITIDPQNNKKFSVTLTQADTLQFATDRPVQIQLRVLMANGTACASDVITLDIGRILKDGVISA